MNDVPCCERCGRDDAMILHADGEWVCHHTHPFVEDNMNTVAIEDLITVVCETFVDQLAEMSSIEVIDKISKLSLREWYMGMTDQERRKFSEVLLDRIEKDMEEIGKHRDEPRQ